MQSLTLKNLNNLVFINTSKISYTKKKVQDFPLCTQVLLKMFAYQDKNLKYLSFTEYIALRLGNYIYLLS